MVGMGIVGKALPAEETNQLCFTHMTSTHLSMVLEVCNVKLLKARRTLDIGVPQFDTIMQMLFKTLLEATLYCIYV